VALKRAVFNGVIIWLYFETDLFGASVLGHGLGSFTYCVFGQFTWQQKTNGSLNFPTGNGRPFVVVSQSTGFGGDAFEQIVDEAVHDAHGF